MNTKANVYLLPTEIANIGKFTIASYDEPVFIDDVNMFKKLACGIKNNRSNY